MGIKRDGLRLNKFLTYIKLLSDQPHLGIARDDIRKGYRVYHVGRHLIFYRQKSTGIEIIRILHDRMDVETHLRRG